MKTTYILIIYFSIIQYQLYSQFTKTDTINARHYIDSASNSPLFSLKRQYFLDSALVVNHINSNLWQQKAMPLFKQKKYEIGMMYLDSAVKYDKSLSYQWLEYRAFIKCIFQKSYSASINDFNLLKIKNSNAIIMDHCYDFYIGINYLQLNQIDSALIYFNTVIKDDISKWGNDGVHHLHYFYLGIVYLELEKYTIAKSYFDKALLRYPQFPDALYYKGICLFNLSNKSEALKSLKEAKLNIEKGYTINEDNAIYETYPYQTDINKVINCIMLYDK